MVDEEARARQIEMYRERLSAFVLRARRTEAHSLAQDKHRLMAWAQSTRNVNVMAYTDGTTRTTISWSTPPEEQLESAAARVRPFILVGEPVYYASVLKAIEGLISKPPPESAANFIASVRKMWKTYDANYDQIRGYEMHVEDNETGATGRMTDNVLGFAWIYGDTVHHDQKRLREADAFGLEHRYQAAVPLVAGIMAAAIATLNFVRDLSKTGHLALEEELFTLPVVVTETEHSNEAELYSSEVGTPLPEGLEELGPEWKKFNPFDELGLTSDDSEPTSESNAYGSDGHSAG
ncbi:hypothetical protein [Nakamurella sp.]|uniref:hypothetical protein n=1 Tax=Nakamurella sp. TaxID=1869182 RepID=UPI003B3BB078